MDKEIVEYFINLGFKVDWDFSKSGSKWYEFIYNGEMLAQIDMNIPLEQILEDLGHYKNIPGYSGDDGYVISSPPDKFQKFLDLLPL